MNYLTRREDASGWRSRHPIVCLLDLCCILLGLGAIWARPETEYLLLPTAIIFQYSVSLAYHYRPLSPELQRLDHLAIVLLIAGTYVHYWSLFLSAPASSWYGLSLALSAAFGIAPILWKPRNGKLRGVVYLAIGAIGLTITLLHPEMLPYEPFWWFLLGVAVYFLQYVVLITRPMLLPGVIEGDEIRHVMLLYAGALHLSLPLMLA